MVHLCADDCPRKTRRWSARDGVQGCLPAFGCTNDGPTDGSQRQDGFSPARFVHPGGCERIAHVLHALCDLNPQTTVTSVNGVTAYDLMFGGQRQRCSDTWMEAVPASLSCACCTVPLPSICGRTILVSQKSGTREVCDQECATCWKERRGIGTTGPCVEESRSASGGARHQDIGHPDRPP